MKLKEIWGKTDLDFDEFFVKVSSIHDKDTRGASNDNLSSANTNLDIVKNQFKHRVVDKWNELPIWVKMALSMNDFKNNYDLWKRSTNCDN